MKPLIKTIYYLINLIIALGREDSHPHDERTSLRLSERNLDVHEQAAELVKHIVEDPLYEARGKLWTS